MTKETDIASIGKYGLLDLLNNDLKFKKSSSIIGRQEDAVVVSDNLVENRVISSSLLLEGVNFDLIYTPLKHLGYKAVIDAISKIVAMNAVPSQVIINIGVSKRFVVEDLEEIKLGVFLASETYQLDVLQIDVNTSYTGLTVATTGIGFVDEGFWASRSNAANTDLICVSGDFGAAYMGLQLLEREKSIYASQIKDGVKTDFQPDFSGKEYLLERQLKPEARLDIIKLLREKSIKPTSMIEVKDGLSSALMQLCKASNTGCRIYEDKIPIDYQTAIMAEEFSMNITTIALNGGDDYELLFTVPLAKYEDISSVEGIRLIGHISEDKFGMLLETRDGVELQLKAQGFVDKE